MNTPRAQAIGILNLAQSRAQHDLVPSMKCVLIQLFLWETEKFYFATIHHRRYRQQCLRRHLEHLDPEIPYHRVRSHVQVLGINFQDYL